MNKGENMNRQIKFMASMQYPIFTVVVISVVLEFINKEAFPHGATIGCIIALGMAYYWTMMRFVNQAKGK